MVIQNTKLRTLFRSKSYREQMKRNQDGLHAKPIIIEITASVTNQTV